MLYMLRAISLVFLTLILTPFLILLGITLLFFNLVHIATRFSRQPAPTLGAPKSRVASIVILNWNGKDLLAQGLPSVLEAVQADGRPHEVMVVDNGSEDGSCEFVRSTFPTVRLLALNDNLGFAQGNNLGVQAAANEIVVLLNNDMVVDRGFLQPILDGFGPDTFAVSSQIFLQNMSAVREETGKTTAAFRRGMIDFSHAPLEGRKLGRPYYPAFWAGGGSSAFHRGRFLAIGGFSEVYSPAYVEDTDLSYRAWSVGWEVLFAPASIVFHKHRGTTRRRFSTAQLQSLIQRNQFFFIWRNIRNWRLLLSHCALLPWTCYRLARDHGLAIWLALISASMRIPSVEIAGLGTPFRRVRSDRDIFGLFAQPGAYFARTRDRVCADAESEYDSRPRILWVSAYLPHLGRHAGAARMYQLLLRLASHYRITLLSFLEYDSEQEYVSELESLCESVRVMRRRPPFRWQLFAYEPFDEFRTPEMTTAVHECIEERDFALIQLEYSQMAVYADSDLGIPCLLTKHEVDFAACARRSRVERNPFLKLRWFYNYLQVLDREVRLVKRVDAAICMTDTDARALRKFCSSVPVHVLNTGVDLEYFRPPAAPARNPRLVFVGAFQHHPNVDAMVYFSREILPLVRAKMPETEFAIVGSNPPPAIAALSEVPGVEITGFVPDIRPYMESSAVYVVPLRLGVGIRGKILEAWSMAMPVVATPVACAGLRYEHGRNLLVADTAQAFADCIVGLLQDEELRNQIGAEGRRTAEAWYGWDASARELELLYRQYIAENTAGSASPRKVSTLA